MSDSVYYHQGCPVCGRMLRIGVRLLGQRVYCQHCGGGFRATDETLEEDSLKGMMKWTQLCKSDSAKSHAPVARAHHATVVVEDSMFVFGGTKRKSMRLCSCSCLCLRHRRTYLSMSRRVAQ